MILVKNKNTGKTTTMDEGVYKSLKSKGLLRNSIIIGAQSATEPIEPPKQVQEAMKERKRRSRAAESPHSQEQHQDGHKFAIDEQVE